ncbi:MAG: AT hook domain-containing protein, partial [Erysipelotrichaceae bacterium]
CVRYYLDDLDRNPMYPAKKRGRPAKSEEEKLMNRKIKLKKNTADLSRIVTSWLEENSWEYCEEKDNIIATHEGNKWVINVQGIKRGRKQTLPVRLSEV